ncbi:MAG TPA: hypothetical protein VM925_33555 [Labilithrix sp.]|nr:hypothetical protein [Labilithrix sp.]
MTHPSSLDLEAFACGEGNTSVEDHVAECASCGAFVERLRGALSAGPSRSRAADVVARAAARGEVTEEAGREGPLERHAASSNARKVAHRRWFLKAASVAVPLAAAAALLLFLRTPKSGNDTEGPTSKTPATSEPIALATPVPEPETSFKGSVQVAVIRERAGQQSRFSGRVGVKPGDRLRVEVALDREQTILAAVMGDDASWLELMSVSARRPGTHFSERSARIDASPLRGTILVGSPESMRRAKESKDLSGVSAVRVEWEGAP